MDKPMCSIESCDGVVWCKALCRKHYNASRHEARRDVILVQMKVRSAAHYAANREAILARNAAHQRANRERYRGYARKRYQRDPESGRAARLASRARNLEAERVRDRAHQKAHPEIYRRKTALRRARKRANGVFVVTARDDRRAVLRFDRACAYCRQPLGAKFDWDHVIPISRGGVHSVGNLVPACEACNGSKHARTVMEWRLGIVLSKR